jgi:hypothetical protein
MGDVARLEAADGGVFSVDINGVLIRGHFVRIDRPNLIEIAWGEAGNEAMPPGTTRLRVTLEARGPITRVSLEHTGLVPSEAAKHAIGWPHFIERLGVAARGGDPGPIPGGSRRLREVSKTRPLRRNRALVRRPGELQTETASVTPCAQGSTRSSRRTCGWRAGRDRR